MRELKFRAWDKRNNCWYTPGTGFEVHWLGGIVTHEDGESTGWAGDIPFEVMQFTGLKDRNGTPIYDGDIIRVEPSSFAAERYKTGTKIEKVYWEEDWGGWLPFNYDLRDSSDDYLPERSEVIGNIYENPDLLK